MEGNRKKDPSYEWVTLRKTNISYVASVTGYTRDELKQILEHKRKKGEYEVKLPLGVRIFTREER
jgi:hypothetical protein